jgi:hypothetical protein
MSENGAYKTLSVPPWIHSSNSSDLLGFSLSNYRMSRLAYRRVHWLVPTTMVGSCLAGLLLALGHHLFYSSLNSQVVPTASYHLIGHSLSIQQVNTSIGTAFAFLVRTFLALAISAAYVQVFWRSLRNTGGKRPSTLNELDWAHAGLSNIFGLFNFRFGSKYPLLVCLAAVFWYVPICIDVHCY